LECDHEVGSPMIAFFIAAFVYSLWKGMFQERVLFSELLDHQSFDTLIFNIGKARKILNPIVDHMIYIVLYISYRLTQLTFLEKTTKNFTNQFRTVL